MKFAFALMVIVRVAPVKALDFLLPSATELSGFGSFLAQPDMGRSSFGFVPRSSVVLGMPQAKIHAPASGAVVYIQREAPQFSSIFSFPLGNAIAIEHPEKFVSVIAGLDGSAPATFEAASHENGEIARVSEGATISGIAGSGVFAENFFGVSLYDIKNALWINPIFLAPWIVDHSAPVIQSVTLARVGAANGEASGAPTELVPARGSKDTVVSCAQGNYSIAVAAYDAITPGTNAYSAPYRFAAVLDGKTVLDTSFLGAKRSENGLSFLGNQAPSLNAVTSKGLLKIGNIVLPKGEHDLSVHISDYSGNVSSIKSRLLVR